jgi:Ni,Fe-hydrogenase III component G
MNSIIKAAANVAEELNPSNENSGTKNEGIQHIKTTLGESFKKKWERKAKEDQCIVTVARELISQEDTFQWLSTGDQKGEAKIEIIAAQEQEFQSKYHATKIFQTERDSKCRLWK